MQKKHRFPVILLFGIVIILIGAAILVDRVFQIPLISTYWPIGALLLAVPIIILMFRSKIATAIFTIPLCIIALFALLVYLQTTFNIWATWAYIWPLVFVAIGIGLLIIGAIFKTHRTRPWAGMLIAFGMVLFLLLGAYFELYKKISGDDPIIVYILTGGLILFGLFLVFNGWFFRPKKPTVAVEPTVEIPEYPPVTPQEEPSILVTPPATPEVQPESLLEEIQEEVAEENLEEEIPWKPTDDLDNLNPVG